MKRISIIFLLMSIFPVFAAETLPEWFIPLREAVFEQKLTAEQIEPLYKKISEQVKSSLTGEKQLLLLSRSEYLIGHAYQDGGNNKKAIPHYEEGMRLAQEALDKSPSAEGWQMLSENLSLLCTAKSFPFAMANGLDVAKYAKNALALDKRNAAAQKLAAGRWVFAPFPFHDHQKGISMMKAIIKDGDMQKDDKFNVYVAIGYGYMKQEDSVQANEWISKAISVYPSNKYAKSLMDEIKKETKK